MFKDISGVALEGFFLVRPKGFHPATGEKFIPTVAQMLDGELFAVDNELDPLRFGTMINDNYVTLGLDGLEWCELPQ